jgi:putative transposase
MPLIYAPRLPAFDYIGFYRYSLTIRTFDRRKVFISDAAVQPVVMKLSQTADAHRFSVIAYCVMPDHLHALVAGEHEAADVREFVRIFKQQTSFEWKRAHGTSLWQRGYFDHVLRDDEDTFVVARYIIENPVRAGLVASPPDYPYLGSLTVSVRDLFYSVQIERT